MHFLQFLEAGQALTTFLGPHLRPLDLAVLRAVCHKLRAQIAPSGARCGRAQALNLCISGQNYALFEYICGHKLRWSGDTLALCGRARGPDFAAQCRIAQALLDIGTVAFSGNLPLLKHLRRAGWSFGIDIIDKALSGGHLPVIEWLWPRAKVRPRNLPELVLQTGRPEIFKWAVGVGISFGHVEGALIIAAEYGGLPMLQALVEIGGRAPNASIMGWATIAGDVPMLKWLLAQGCPCPPAIARIAVQNGTSWALNAAMRPFPD